MYYCPDCGYEFKVALRYTETHNLDYPPFEDVFVCPNCKGRNYYEKIETHCRCCGARLSENLKEYCSESCYMKGMKMWNKEKARRKINEKSPLTELTREVKNFNRKNNTEYSYGQYVALVRPKLNK